MFKKIISFMLAAACTAAAAQTVFAWDGSVKTVNDSRGAVQIYTTSVQDENDPNTYTVFYTDKDGSKLNGRIYGDFADENELAPRLLLTDFKDGKANFVYGFTKNSVGRRYYVRGERAYGWKKIKGYWYHFDTKTGYAATGKTKICGAVYTFDEKGRWTSRVSKSGAAPEDFSVSISNGNNRGFDTAKKKIYYGRTGGGVQEAKIKIPAADRQVLWCMFLESGFEWGRTETFNDIYMIDFCDRTFTDGDYSIYGSDPETVYTVTVTAGGKKAKISYNTDTAQIALFDEKAYFAQLLCGGCWEYYGVLKEKYPYSGNEDELDYID